jgi:hypothetical protein
MPNRRRARGIVVPEGGDQAVKVAGDNIAAVVSARFFIPCKKMVERRSGRKIARPQRQAANPRAGLHRRRSHQSGRGNMTIVVRGRAKGSSPKLAVIN